MLLPGSWIGGDRDGNPFVTADALRRATTRQAETALGHHLAELEALRDELSMSDRLVTPTPELYHLAEASRDDSPFRADEPYRRALNGISARLAATARAVLGRVARAGAARRAAALRLARTSCAPTSTSSTRRCAATAPARSPTTGCSGCARRWRSSASTCAGWTCGRTPPSTSRCVGELLAWAGVCDDYAALDEAARVELLAGELTLRRPLVRPDAELSEDRARRARRAARGGRTRWRCSGPRTIPNYVISMCESVSDVLEVAVLLKEVGLLDPGAEGGPTCSVGISPLFETIDDLQGRRRPR